MTDRTTARRVSRNAVSNVAVIAFDMLASMLLVAFMLRILTREMYGLWALTGAVFAYSAVLQLGLNSAVSFMAPPLLLKKDYEQLSRVASTALASYLVAAAVLAVATVGITAFFPTWFHISAPAAGTAQVVVALVGMYFVLAIPLGVFQGLLSGTQEYVAMNIARLLCRLARAVLIVALLWSGFGVIGLAVAHVTTRLAESLAMPFLVRRRLPELTLRLTLASWAVFKGMFAYSAFSLLWSTAALVRDRASFVVIGIFLSPGTAAAFQIPVTLLQAFDSVTQSLAAVTKPAASALMAESRPASVESLVLTGGRAVSALVLPLVAFGALYADVLIPLWVGDRYPEASRLVVFLTLSQAPLTVQAVTGYVLIGVNRHRELAIATLASSLAGVGLMIVLVGLRGMGLWGVAFGASLSMLVMGLFVIPFLASRALGIRWLSYVEFLFAIPLLALAPPVAIAGWVRGWATPLGVWTVVWAAAISAPVLLVLNYVVVLTPAERRWLRTRLAGLLPGRLMREG